MTAVFTAPAPRRAAHGVAVALALQATSWKVLVGVALGFLALLVPGLSS